MERDVEGQAGVLPAEEPGDERQVRRAADGKELGQTLDHAQRDRLDDIHVLLLKSSQNPSGEALCVEPS
ncbi:hypothetical protein D3C72_2186360 [compost metagenome]